MNEPENPIVTCSDHMNVYLLDAAAGRDLLVRCLYCFALTLAAATPECENFPEVKS